MAEHHSYVGSGPYCYANSLAMMLGKDSPSPAVIEFATSSPFGMQMIGGEVAFFDPYGWDPTLAFDAALKAAGWEATSVIGSDANDALARLKVELAKGNAVFVGPVEMGLLRYQPDMRGAIGADHYVVVLRITDDDEVEVHDPQGYPYATLPIADFMAAWRADKIPYGKPFMMRTDFRKVEPDLSEEDVIRRSLANGRSWLSMKGEHDMPPGSCGNGTAAEKLAQMIESKTLSQGIRMPLIHFAVRVGARRLADAATCLGRIGEAEAAKIMAKQARLVGALQRPLIDGDDGRVVSLLRELAPTYEALREVLDS